MAKYNHQKVELKWRRKWEKDKRWKINLKTAKKPYYNLMMFPYPSAEGLHVGNVYAFTGSDIHGRFRRMQGNNVFEPIGYDAFGIHSENFAIKKGIHPRILVKRNTKNFERQLRSLGSLFDWDHAVDTTDPAYYKWTQWIFLQLYKAGLAYKAKAAVDWCSSCKTVLADEQVISGKCERCGTEVIQKELEQWFFKITKYADRLLRNLEKIDWSERTKIAQRNWIGRSEGAELEFKVFPTINNKQLAVKVFTTRPDTLFGVTYMVLAPEHSLVAMLLESRNSNIEIRNKEEILDYIAKAKKKNELERTELEKEKTGVELKGVKAINPANQEEVPVFIADYVLASYGTGAIMAVPGHDARDMEFAKKYSLPVKEVVAGGDMAKEAYVGSSVLINSGRFNGMPNEKAKWEITKFVKGKKTAKYHLRDWLISRQRYWGPPIPIVYCDRCGTVPVPEKDLPVLLPYAKNFRPEGTGKSPLASVKSFVNTKCPQCKGPAQRETDVSDTFLDSAWYFLRYPSVGANPKFEARSSKQIQNPKSKVLNTPWDPEITRRWLPVDMYIGGQEHAVLHLLYARFTTMALHDFGFIDFQEPFKKFRAHGLLTKDGTKMSKSKGNVVNPDEVIKQYGADTLRMYLMFMGPFIESADWSDKGIVGVYRFLGRIWSLCARLSLAQKRKSDPGVEMLRHKTIKKVTEDMEELRYNTAISALMEFLNRISSSVSHASKKDIETLLILLSPFAPYITEELWQGIGFKGSVHDQKWPSYEKKFLKEENVRLVLQVNGRVRDVVEVPFAISEEKIKSLAMENGKIKKWTEGKEIKRVIIIPGKLANIVV